MEIKETTEIYVSDQLIDVMSLPEVAKQELITFYEYLVFKYLGQAERKKPDKNSILERIFKEADGKLPANYTFNRAELHER